MRVRGGRDFCAVAIGEGDEGEQQLFFERVLNNFKFIIDAFFELEIFILQSF